MSSNRVLRIGEVSRRTGVAVSTLRAWERRYGLLDPERTEGGHRLYGTADIERVRRMQALLDQGWSASAAADEIIGNKDDPAAPTASISQLRPVEGSGDPAEDLVTRLTDAFNRFDAQAADAVIDDCFARLDVGAALDEVLLPTIRDVADGWEEDPGIIAREHFATHTLRPRLIRLLRAGNTVDGRVLVAASPEYEEHDLGVLSSSVVASSVGYRVHFLGSRTPVPAIERTIASVGADIAMIGAVSRATATDFLRRVKPDDDVVWILGGPGFNPEDVESLPQAVFHHGPYRDVRRTLDRAVAIRQTTGSNRRSDDADRSG